MLFLILSFFVNFRIVCRRMMSASKARWHCIYLIIASFVFNSWILFIADINEYGVCDILPEYEFIYKVRILKFEKIAT